MIKRKMLIGLLAFSTQLQAGTLYKCIKNGMTIYQERQCVAQSEEIVIGEDKPRKQDEGVMELHKAFEDKLGVAIGSITVEPTYIQSGYQFFSYAVAVTNTMNRIANIRIPYLGLNSRGLTVDKIYIEGNIPSKSTRTLTDTRIMKLDLYNSITKWEIEY